MKLASGGSTGGLFVERLDFMIKCLRRHLLDEWIYIR